MRLNQGLESVGTNRYDAKIAFREREEREKRPVMVESRMRREVMSFDVLHLDDLLNNRALVELSHVVSDVMIRGQEFLVALW
jgi:hypothetical protein